MVMLVKLAIWVALAQNMQLGLCTILDRKRLKIDTSLRYIRLQAPALVERAKHTVLRILDRFWIRVVSC